MVMLPKLPISSSAGVPESTPVEVLNVAQDGRFAMLKVSGLPSGSEALGWKLYVASASSEVTGEPLMTGGRFAWPPTRIVKEGNDAEAVASLTVMVMRAEVPTSAAVGVPFSRPVLVLNVAQAGRFWMDQVSALPSGSLATGRKL